MGVNVPASEVAEVATETELPLETVLRTGAARNCGARGTGDLCEGVLVTGTEMVVVVVPDFAETAEAEDVCSSSWCISTMGDMVGRGLALGVGVSSSDVDLTVTVGAPSFSKSFSGATGTTGTTAPGAEGRRRWK
jgi:hypothetical protein